MNVQEMTSPLMIPLQKLSFLKITQQEILQQLKELRSTQSNILPVNHLTAMEFMAAVKICRSKFEQLVSTNKIRIVKRNGRSMFLSQK
jgi:hypothetical protein